MQAALQSLLLRAAQQTQASLSHQQKQQRQLSQPLTGSVSQRHHLRQKQKLSCQVRVSCT